MVYDAVWIKTEFGYEFIASDETICNGDKVQVYILDKGEEFPIASHIISILKSKHIRW